MGKVDKMTRRLVSQCGIEETHATKTHSVGLQLVIFGASLQPAILACRLMMSHVTFQSVQAAKRFLGATLQTAL